MTLRRHFNYMRTSALCAVGLLVSAPVGALAQDAMESAAPWHYAGSAHVHRIALFPSASNVLGRQGFARVINHSRLGGEVSIEAFDDAGVRHGPLVLELGPGETVHFNSSDLERGNSAKGLAGATGAGEGDWRLELKSELDIEVLSYIRTRDGFLTSMHDRVTGDGAGRRVAVFNPGRNVNQVSLLRLINSGAKAAGVRIEGVDDLGESPGSAVTLTLPAGTSRTVSARQLESGEGRGLSGALGTGAGKWQLHVTSDEAIEVMSLLSSPTGHLTNLSSVQDTDGSGEARAALRYAVQFFPAAARWTREGIQGFARIINLSRLGGEVSIEAFDDAGERHGTVTLEMGAGETVHFNSGDLEEGNAGKGLAGATGAGEGDWRLMFTSDLDIEVLSYIRTSDGFLTSMHDRVPGDGAGRRVAVFNPGRNINQVSLLRLINPGATAAGVRIEGVDDLGESPGSAVTLTLRAGTSRTVSARQLESGEGTGLSGALGTGTGKWQLHVTSDEAIEAMSLLSSPTGHLTNLSTVPSPDLDDAGRFIIAASRPTTVRPLQKITLEVLRGFTDSEYVVLVDLSGTGAFRAADVIEVTGVTTDREQVLFSGPLSELLTDRNTTHSFAVRARKTADATQSNVLHFALDEISIPPEFAGYPTTTMEYLLESVLGDGDHPLLAGERSSLRPGLMAKLAGALDLDLAFSDVQSEALLQSLFGFSLVELLETSQATAPRAAASGGHSVSEFELPEFGLPKLIREFFLGKCLRPTLENETLMPPECYRDDVRDQIRDAGLETRDQIRTISNMGADGGEAFVRHIAETSAGSFFQSAFDKLGWNRLSLGVLKVERLLGVSDNLAPENSKGHFVTDDDGSLLATPRVKQENQENMEDISEFAMVEGIEEALENPEAYFDGELDEEGHNAIDVLGLETHRQQTEGEYVEVIQELEEPTTAICIVSTNEMILELANNPNDCDRVGRTYSTGMSFQDTVNLFVSRGYQIFVDFSDEGGGVLLIYGEFGAEGTLYAEIDPQERRDWLGEPLCLSDLASEFCFDPGQEPEDDEDADFWSCVPGEWGVWDLNNCRETVPGGRDLRYTGNSGSEMRSEQSW